MKLSSPFLSNLGGLAMAVTACRWMGTLDYKIAYYEPSADPVHPEFQGPVIAVFWHEYIPVLTYMRGHTNTSALVSRHQDAEWLSGAARHLGHSVVRGSTNRGGSSALRELLVRGQGQNLALTPDGPRGPRRALSQGPIILSSTLQAPLLIVGIGYDRPWRLPTWDRFALPRPYSRCRVIMGPLAQIPAKLDRDGIERYRAQIEMVLNHLTEEAEDWAESNVPRLGERPMRREGVRSSAFRNWGIADRLPSPGGDARPQARPAA
jgi:lysophospholipid acyltransferase (LPLAT)-like uncharacterized protein